MTGYHTTHTHVNGINIDSKNNNNNNNNNNYYYYYYYYYTTTTTTTTLLLQQQQQQPTLAAHISGIYVKSSVVHNTHVCKRYQHCFQQIQQQQQQQQHLTLAAHISGTELLYRLFAMVSSDCDITTSPFRAFSRSLDDWWITDSRRL